MSTADTAAPAPASAVPVSTAEAESLFADLAQAPALVLAVSGGPDSTALLVLAARWRAALARGPELIAVTVDHGLRPESAGEARAVKRLAAQFGVRHRTLRWSGRKPATGLQKAARAARYGLLADVARHAGAHHVLTGHTLDDQAETVLLRLARGSGMSGLSAMARSARLHVPIGLRVAKQGEMLLVRPLLEIPKARLVATLAAEGIAFVEDPSNADPRFTRARLRALMPALAGEGLDAPRLARLAARLRRAEATIELAVDVAAAAASLAPWSEKRGVLLDAEKFGRLPEEVGLRLLGRAIALVGHEGPVQLGKLEMLHAALLPEATPARIRRTLAGAVVTYAEDRMTIERAPPRRSRGRPPSRRKRSRTLTTRRYDRRKGSKRR